VAKLINILAASVGGGLMLGAGIRLGETLVARGTGAPRLPEEADGNLAARLGALETRLQHLETGAPAPSIERQTSDVAAIRSELAAGEEKIVALREMGQRLRGELQGWLENNVAERMATVESKLRAESESSRKEMLDVFVESVQTRVMHRISRLEEEVAGQSTAMTELRECSLRTEQSMQKLLMGLDRLIVSQQSPASAKAEEPAAQTAAAEAAAPEVRAAAEEREDPVASPVEIESMSRHRRWSIFR